MIRVASLMLTIVLALVLSTVQAQDKADKKAKGQLPAGWKDLALTAEQKAAIYKTQAEYKTKILKLEEEIKALKSEERAALAKHLTEAQKAKLTAALTGEKTEPKKDKAPDPKK